MARILLVIAILLPIGAAVFMARWNFVHGKGDRRGAMRLAVLIFSLHMALWLFQAHFSSAGNFIYLLFACHQHLPSLGCHSVGALSGD